MLACHLPSGPSFLHVALRASCSSGCYIALAPVTCQKVLNRCSRRSGEEVVLGRPGSNSASVLTSE